jgi:ABC-2 type transport system permease protein
VRAQAQYRASFAIDLTGSILLTLLDLLAVLVLFRVTRSLAGFDLHQAFVIATLSGLSFAIADFCVGNVERLGAFVRAGQLDALLVRPRSVLAQLIATDFAFRRVGQVIEGAVALAVACHLAHLHWTLARVVLLVLCPVCGAVFFMALYVAGATVSFYWTESGEFANAFTYGGRTLTAYPISVYGGLFRRIFGYAFGFAFVAYYPGLLLLGRSDPLGGPAWLGWCTPLVAALAVLLAAFSWRTGIRHYRSSGS